MDETGGMFKRPRHLQTLNFITMKTFIYIMEKYVTPIFLGIIFIWFFYNFLTL
jgi:hypothetical protein